jgi:hypothetical protein
MTSTRVGRAFLVLLHLSTVQQYCLVGTPKSGCISLRVYRDIRVHDGDLSVA